MRLGAKLITGCWGFDTDTILTPAKAAEMAETPMTVGGVNVGLPAFAMRYPTDVSLVELDGILAVMALGFVGHPRKPKYNVLSDATGAADALSIMNAMGRLGINPLTCRTDDGQPLDLFNDMEGVQNPGPGPQAHVERYSVDVQARSFGVGYYFGFQWGFTNYTSLAAKGPFRKWVDFGSLTMRPAFSWDIRQHPTQLHCGVPVDPNQMMGAAVLLVGLPDEVDVNVEGGDPAAGQTPEPAAGGGDPSAQARTLLELRRRAKAYMDKHPGIGRVEADRLARRSFLFSPPR